MSWKKPKNLLVFVLVPFFLLLFFVKFVSIVNAGCASGDYCAGTTVLQVKNGCTEVWGGTPYRLLYCTQRYSTEYDVQCNSSCTYTCSYAKIICNSNCSLSYGYNCNGGTCCVTGGPTPPPVCNPSCGDRSTHCSTETYGDGCGGNCTGTRDCTPPTCTVTGPISVCVDASASYNVTSANAPSGSEIWKSPTGSQSWINIRPKGVNGSSPTTFSPAGTYYVVCNAYNDPNGSKCSGNPWPLPAGWSDCGPNDRLTVTVNPTINGTWHASCNTNGGCGRSCDGASCGGTCPGSAPSCATNGVCNAWSGWSACSSCSQTRTRTYTAPSCGGSNVSCPLSESQACGATNGVCGAAHYSCSAGTNPSGSNTGGTNVSGPSAWTWRCNGSCGGASPSCSENKPTASCTVAPVACGGNPGITLHSTNGYYCYIYNDWSNCNTGYFGSGTCYPGPQTPGAHQGQVYCYNSNWNGSGWNTCNYTVPPVAVNGGWTLFGACSKTCGTGTQTRTCTNPSPNSCGTGCSGLDGGNSSRACNTQACIPAWWQVKDGDVTTNGNLQSKVPTTAIPPYFELPGGGGFPGIPSYNTTGTATFTPGGVSANGWLAASSYTPKIYDNYKSSYFLNEVPSDASVTTIPSPSAPATTFTSGGTLKYGYYWYEYDGNNEFNINSDITAANLGTRKVILIIKNANFKITNKINLDDGSGFFMAVVGGNIIVDSGVGGGGSANLEGIYIADGQFQTGTTGSETDSQLWIRGTVAAYGGITLQRRLGDILNKTIPAELFEYAPDQDILFPSVLGRTVSNWQEVAP